MSGKLIILFGPYCLKEYKQWAIEELGLDVLALLFDLVRSFILMTVSLDRKWKGIYVQESKRIIV
jgi:hypothetical protein